MKRISRDAIQRMVGGISSSSSVISGGGGGGGGVSQYWVDDNYVSKEFFNRLFEIHDENGEPILPNDVETEIDNIQAMFGFWTNAYLSALGQNEGGGGAELTLASLADVAVQGVTDGQALVWSAAQGKWVPGEGGGGLDPTAMWAELATTGTQQINKTHLTTALADYLPLAGGTMTSTSLVTNMNADLLDGHHATDFALASAITDMATQTWVSTNYLSKTDATSTYLTKTEANTTYLSIAFFRALFRAYTSGGSEVVPNGGSTSTIDNIKAMFGFWTNSYLSALGNNPGGASLTLSSLSDVSISGATAGQVLTYRNGTWRNETPQGGGTDMQTVWQELAATGTEQINASHLSTALRPYATQSWVTQQIASVPESTTAEKLKTARTIWGQSFDGTSNVTGSFWLGNSTDNRFYVRSQTSGERHLHSGFLYDTAYHEAFVFATGYTASRIVFYNNTPLDLYAGRDYLTKTPALCIYDGRVSINKMLPDTGYNLDVDGAVRASSFVKLNGTSSQFLKADGSVDSNIYALSSSLSGYLPLSGGTMSNINLVTNLNAQYLNGYGPYNGTNSGYVFINDHNFCEMGTHIEFHYDKTSGLDYSTLLRCTGNHRNLVSLPSGSGTLALTTDNVASATKLQTARTIWGQSFDGTANVSGAITDATTITASSNVSVGGTLSVTGATTLSSTLSVSGNATLGGDILMNSGGRIHVKNEPSGASLYIGNSNDAGWVYMSDMCSRQGNGYWKILSNGNSEFANVYSRGYVTALSDIRHKDILGDVGLTVNEVANAPAVKFLWKDRRQEGLQVGSIAQYWQKVLPEAIVEAADGELTMSYGVIALLASIANAREIVNLKREIAELKRKLQKHGIFE